MDVIVKISPAAVEKLFEVMKTYELSFEQALRRVVLNFPIGATEKRLQERLRQANDDLAKTEKRAARFGKELREAKLLVKAQTKDFNALYDTLNESDKIVMTLIEELRIKDDLLETRNQLLEMIPACPLHGNQCVSHAKQWIVDRLVCDKCPMGYVSSECC